jgi:hypothetical protein
MVRPLRDALAPVAQRMIAATTQGLDPEPVKPVSNATPLTAHLGNRLVTR